MEDPVFKQLRGDLVKIATSVTLSENPADQYYRALQFFILYRFLVIYDPRSTVPVETYNLLQKYLNMVFDPKTYPGEKERAGPLYHLLLALHGVFFIPRSYVRTHAFMGITVESLQYPFLQSVLEASNSFFTEKLQPSFKHNLVRIFDYLCKRTTPIDRLMSGRFVCIEDFKKYFTQPRANTPIDRCLRKEWCIFFQGVSQDEIVEKPAVIDQLLAGNGEHVPNEQLITKNDVKVPTPLGITWLPSYDDQLEHINADEYRRAAFSNVNLETSWALLLIMGWNALRERRLPGNDDLPGDTTTGALTGCTLSMDCPQQYLEGPGSYQSEVHKHAYGLMYGISRQNENFAEVLDAIDFIVRHTNPRYRLGPMMAVISMQINMLKTPGQYRVRDIPEDTKTVKEVAAYFRAQSEPTFKYIAHELSMMVYLDRSYHIGNVPPYDEQGEQFMRYLRSTSKIFGLPAVDSLLDKLQRPASGQGGNQSYVEFMLVVNAMEDMLKKAPPKSSIVKPFVKQFRSQKAIVADDVEEKTEEKQDDEMAKGARFPPGILMRNIPIIDLTPQEPQLLRADTPVHQMAVIPPNSEGYLRPGNQPVPGTAQGTLKAHVGDDGQLHWVHATTPAHVSVILPPLPAQFDLSKLEPPQHQPLHLDLGALKMMKTSHGDIRLDGGPGKQVMYDFATHGGLPTLPPKAKETPARTTQRIQLIDKVPIAQMQLSGHTFGATCTFAVNPHLPPLLVHPQVPQQMPAKAGPMIGAELKFTDPSLDPSTRHGGGVVKKEILVFNHDDPANPIPRILIPKPNPNPKPKVTVGNPNPSLLTLAAATAATAPSVKYPPVLTPKRLITPYSAGSRPIFPPISPQLPQTTSPVGHYAMHFQSSLAPHQIQQAMLLHPMLIPGQIPHQWYGYDNPHVVSQAPTGSFPTTYPNYGGPSDENVGSPAGETGMYATKMPQLMNTLHERAAWHTT